MEEWSSLPKDIISIIERYCYKSIHRDAMKRNYVFEDIKGYRRRWCGIVFVNSEGKTHREHGPAIIQSNGTTVTRWWFKEGKIHRDGDNPAVILSNGYKLWYKEGKLHRENGPAEIWPNGSEEYWINGNRIK